MRGVVTIPRGTLVGILGVVVAWVAGVLLGGAAAGASRYANPQLLVETDEVAKMLGTPGVRIVDLRSGVTGGLAYRTGHVPGAVTTVVAYDEGGSMLAVRLFFVLEYFGLQHVRLLNGGLAKWKREGRAFESLAPSIPPRHFDLRPRREALATAGEVQASLGKPDACLIDARSPSEFTAKDRGASRGGHIPRAANVYWTSTLNPDGTLKDADALQALFGAQESARTAP